MDNNLQKGNVLKKPENDRILTCQDEPKGLDKSLVVTTQLEEHNHESKNVFVSNSGCRKTENLHVINSKDGDEELLDVNATSMKKEESESVIFHVVSYLKTSSICDKGNSHLDFAIQNSNYVEVENKDQESVSINKDLSAIYENKSIAKEKIFENTGDGGCTFFSNDFEKGTLAKEKLKCEFCSKEFDHQSTLRIHRRVHTGERPFKCDTCSNSFSRRGLLQQHLRIHTGEKPYQCMVCAKRFRCQSTFQNHLLTHTGEKPFQCGTCLKYFTQKVNLRNHMFLHTGERPYKCETCGKTFNRKGTLKTHVFTHSKEKPFKCDNCGTFFTQKSSLRNHLRKICV